MDYSMIVWLSIASLIVVLATVKCIRASVNRLKVSHKTAHNAQESGRHVKQFGFGSEREELWIPGDLPMYKQYDDEAID